MPNEEPIDIDRMDYENLDEGVNRLIDIISQFKSADSMNEIDDDQLIEFVNSLQMTLFTAVSILYNRGQMWTDEDCDHEHPDEDDE